MRVPRYLSNGSVNVKLYFWEVMTIWHAKTRTIAKCWIQSPWKREGASKAVVW